MRGEGTVGKTKGKYLGMEKESNKPEPIHKTQGSSEGLRVFLIVGGCPGSLISWSLSVESQLSLFPLSSLGRGENGDRGEMERRKVRLKSRMHGFAFSEIVGLLAPPFSLSCGCRMHGFL